MIAVIFEVEPEEGRAGDYLGIAAELRPLLDAIDGFISIERFESLTQRGKYLSLSFWRDEAAVAAWRNTTSTGRRKGQDAAPFSRVTACALRRSCAAMAWTTARKRRPTARLSIEVELLN